ncbi:MAG: hypothetical protein ACRCTX_13030, partial [Afipia sp.]
MAGGGEDRERSQGRAGRAIGRAISWPPRSAVPAGAAYLTEGVSAFLSGKVRSWVAAEAGPGRLLPWVPVAF